MKKTHFKLVFSLLCLIFITVCSNSTAQERAAVISKSFEVKYDTACKVTQSYEVPECFVSPSPSSSELFNFEPSEKIISYCVSPVGDCVGVIVGKDAKSSLQVIDSKSKKKLFEYLLPSAGQFHDLCWHPKANALFLIGESDKGYDIYRLTKEKKVWTMTSIYRTTLRISNLIISPLPYVTRWDNELKCSYYAYRLLFAETNGGSVSTRIMAVTESGSKPYQVLGWIGTRTIFAETDEQPSYSTAYTAQPIAFHPRGNQLIYRNQNNGFSILPYEETAWGKDSVRSQFPEADMVEPMPNGLGFLTWRKDNSGLGYYNIISKKEEILLPDVKFLQAPKVLPDGKAIVALTLNIDKEQLAIIPVVTPLPDVQNAYMFAKSEKEMGLYSQKQGLFRPNSGAQLYEIYETENYSTSSITSLSRPYIVTTDIFWELFASAYQGLFILKEREDAIPLFWRFSEQADAYLSKNQSNSKWSGVFRALIDLKNLRIMNSEVAKMINETPCVSTVSESVFDFGELKARGHYATTPELTQYFRGFKYFTSIFAYNPAMLEDLSRILPPEIQSDIVGWITSYNGFISPSRAELVWKGIKNPIPEYCTDPAKGKYIFPLSWGFDNEVLNRTVQHNQYPVELQLNDSENGRWLPSGLDLAAVMGSGLAENLLQSDFQKYPNLKRVIENLKSEFNQYNPSFAKDKNLYNLWMSALSSQWNDTVRSINNNSDSAIWQAKRLQTGLASWTTLRHTTVLVNERTGAEAGEGGYFEELIMKLPRGTVEADPTTFAAIAKLFEQAEAYISTRSATLKDINSYEVKAEKSLYDGMLLRVVEAKKEVLEFGRMSQKVKQGEQLTVEEYDKIREIAGTAEHLFLIFKSLANKDYALSTPDPMAKVVDVAGGGNNGILSEAVGNAIEWDYVTPFYGRKQIVKGSIYSYYEFKGKDILNDEEWRKKVKTQIFPTWIKPFITYQKPAILQY